VSSAGQIVGGIVGAVIGFVASGFNPTGAYYGFVIGSAIGTAIDPPSGPKIEGPRLSDLKQQISTYGAVIPRVYGAMAIHGNVFWIKGNQLDEVSATSEQGGKGGGGGAEVTTYEYFVTFALGLCEGPISGIGRVWCNGKLLVDFGSTDYATNLATQYAREQFTVYLGNDTQLADPTMEADLGAGNVPAYRGLTYIVVRDFALKDYGNTLAAAQFKVEVFAAQTTTQTKTNLVFPYVAPQSSGSFPPQAYYVDETKTMWGIGKWTTDYPATSEYMLFEGYSDGTFKLLGSFPCSGTVVPPSQYSESKRYLYSALEVFNVNVFSGISGRIFESNGLWVGQSVNGTFSFYVSDGTPASTRSKSLGVEHCVCTDGEFIYVVGTDLTRKYHKDDINTPVATGPGRPTCMVRASACCLDKLSGQLCWIQEFSVGDIYTWSLDLQTVTLLASGCNLTPGSGSPAPLFVKGQIVIVAGGSNTTNDELYVSYNVINIPVPSSVTLASIVTAEALKTKILTAGDLTTTSLTDMVRGYGVSTVTALRGTIDPLRGAWPFDVVQAGYKVKFIRRTGSASVATIPSQDLAATAGDSDKVVARITQSREMDAQIPYRVVINHSDINREYDVNTQYAERLVTASASIRALDLPIVLTPDEAAQKCEILLYMYWLERNEFSIVLPPTYLHLEVGDIITVVESTASFVMRLTSIQYRADGIMECKAKMYSSATYTSAAVGDNSGAAPPNRSTIAIAGPVTTVLADIPVIFDTNVDSGFAVAMAGTTSYWAGGNVYRTLDNGQNWNLVNGFISQSKIGYGLNAISDPITFSLMDKKNVLQVSMLGGLALSSITEAQLLNGANHFAYGVDGRWEIIGAQTCALQADGSYYLYNLLRGRFGTEWASTNHAVNDYLVLLDQNFIQYSLMNNGQIGLQYDYRGVESGGNINDKPDMLFAYKGMNLECLSPVYASGARSVPATNDWTINWIRRTRIGGQLRDGVDATLSEATEAYEIDIFSDSTYSTVKRTLTATSPTVVYTAAQQTTDFGAVQTQLYVGIYQMSATVGRGIPLLAPVPYKHSTLALYHFDALPFKNEVDGNAYSPAGSGTISTSTGVKFGSGAFYGNSGYIWLGSVNSNNIKDFTLEMWVQGQTNGPLLEGELNYYNQNLKFGGGYGTVVVSGCGVEYQGSPIHWAITRKNGTIRVFWGGVQRGTTGYDTRLLHFGTNGLALNYFAGGPIYAYAYFDELRLSDKCLYESNFTPPASPFLLPTGAY